MQSIGVWRRNRLAFAGFLQKAGCCAKRAEDVEDGCIGRNLKIEVQEAVDQDSGDAEDAGEAERSGHFGGPVADFSERLAIENDKEPDHRSEPEEAQFG